MGEPTDSKEPEPIRVPPDPPMDMRHRDEIEPIDENFSIKGKRTENEKQPDESNDQDEDQEKHL